MYSTTSRVFPVVALFIGIVAMTLLVFSIDKLSTPDVALAIDRVDVLFDETKQPPTHRLDWHSVNLPHDWDMEGQAAKEAWYRITLDLNVAPDRLWAIYLPNVYMNAEVYLNSELLGDGGNFSNPVSRNFNRPLYFSIPNGSLGQGENEFYIHVKTDSSGGGLLPTVYLGPAEYVQPVYEARYFYRYTVSFLIVIAMVVAGLFMMMLWVRRRRETIYGWFALVMLEWSLFNLNLVVVNVPFNTHTWDWAMYVAMVWFPILATSFVMRFLGEKNYKLEKWLYVAAVSACALLLSVSNDALYFLGDHVFSIVALVIGVFPVYLLFRHNWDEPNIEVFLLMLSGSLIVVFGGHDVLVMNNFLSREDGFLLHYSAPVALLVFGYILVQRFAGALREYEMLNSELGERVKRKHDELERNYLKLRRLEQQRILGDERERIMRDMHDGMGGHIVSALALLDHGQCDLNSAKDALRLALDDLRLMIDSMDEVEGDLLSVLGMLRHRLEPRLRQVGIKMNWEVSDVPEIPNFGPEKSLHLMRIVQEAITNVIKHSQANALTISVGCKKAVTGKEVIYVDCIDNGKGLPQGVNDYGRGLSNMRRRAQIIGASAEIKNFRDAGTKVTIALPLAA